MKIERKVIVDLVLSIETLLDALEVKHAGMSVPHEFHDVKKELEKTRGMIDLGEPPKGGSK